MTINPRISSTAGRRDADRVANCSSRTDLELRSNNKTITKGCRPIGDVSHRNQLAAICA